MQKVILTAFIFSILCLSLSYATLGEYGGAINLNIPIGSGSTATWTLINTNLTYPLTFTITPANLTNGAINPIVSYSSMSGTIPANGVFPITLNVQMPSSAPLSTTWSGYASAETQPSGTGGGQIAIGTAKLITLTSLPPTTTTTSTIGTTSTSTTSSTSSTTQSTTSVNTTTIAQSSGGGGVGGSGGGSAGNSGGARAFLTIVKSTVGYGVGYEVNNVSRDAAFNISLCGGFRVTDNYITPNTTGITIGSQSYNLSLNYVYEVQGACTVQLLNVSYLPIIDTVSLLFANSTHSTTISTISSTSSSSTTSSTATSSTLIPISTLSTTVSSTLSTSSTTTIKQAQANGKTSIWLYLIAAIIIIIILAILYWYGVHHLA